MIKNDKLTGVNFKQADFSPQIKFWGLFLYSIAKDIKISSRAYTPPKTPNKKELLALIFLPERKNHHSILPFPLLFCD